MNDQEIKDLLSSNCDVRGRAASNPNTPSEVLSDLAKDSDCDVRRRAASNPNTPSEVLSDLAKDSDCDVRGRAASNPNTPGFVDKRIYHTTDSYVATQGTNHLWYKFKGENKPFYVAGCFIGSHEQLVNKITADGGSEWYERMNILSILDFKFDEVFNLVEVN